MSKHIRRSLCRLILYGLILAGVLVGGCGSNSAKPLPGAMLLEKYFHQIIIGKSNATDVLNMLPNQGMMHTTGSVSVLRKQGWSREVGIVVFGQEDSLVQRKIYLQRRSNIITEKVYLDIETILPKQLLEEPYENDMRKDTAILRCCHQMMVEDVKPFKEDQETESLIGLARTGLGVGIHELSIRPREADKLLEAEGFEYVHPTLGNCHLNLRQLGENIFAVSVRSSAVVDLTTGW